MVAVAESLEGWVAAERGRFVLWLPVAMLTGNLWYFAVYDEPPAWLGAALAGPALALAILFRGRRALRGVTLLLASGAIGAMAAQWAAAQAPRPLPLPRHAVQVAGSVRAVESLPTGRRVTLGPMTVEGADGGPQSVRLRLRADDPASVAVGDRVQVRAMLDRPNPPAYPGGWDLQRDAFFVRMAGYGYALGRLDVQAHEPPGGAARRLQALRETIAGRVEAVLPDSAGAISVALLTGQTAAIPEPDRAAFRGSGLAHLLAIAGLHIGIVMGLAFGATRLSLAAWERIALHWPIKSVAALSALAAGGGYLLLTGAHVPIVRSFVMACLVTLGVLAGRRAVSLRGLALAMAALLLIAPEQASGVSFQMSFSAVLALIAGYEALRPLLRRLHGEGWLSRLASHVAGLAVTSALAGTASAPFAAYHFGQVQIYNVLANVAAVPITALWVMPCGLLALLLMPVHLEAVALWPMGWGASAILWIGRTVSALPAATLAVPHSPPWGLALVGLGMAWLGIWRTRLRLAGIAGILAGLLSPMLTTPPDILLSADGRLLAVHANEAVYLQTRPGFSGFTQDAWTQMWGIAPARALPATPEGGLACGEAWCRFQAVPGGPVAALLLDEAPRTEACDADVIVSQQPVRWRCPDSDPWIIDRFTVWHEGAVAIWLRPPVAQSQSDRDMRGRRPWVPPPPDERAP